jgi:hypothetical protein
LKETSQSQVGISLLGPRQKYTNLNSKCTPWTAQNALPGRHLLHRAKPGSKNQNAEKKIKLPCSIRKHDFSQGKSSTFESDDMLHGNLIFFSAFFKN